MKKCRNCDMGSKNVLAMNSKFITNQIRKYTRLRRVASKDAVLTAIGIHAGLLEKKRVILRSLTPAERERVLYFMQQFAQRQGLTVDATELK